MKHAFSPLRLAAYSLAACLILGGLGGSSALAQLPPGLNLPPGFTLPPGMQNPQKGNKKRGRQKNRQSDEPKAAGVPVPMDSPPTKAFQLLQQQTVYSMRMTMQTSNPQMEQMMAQFGIVPTETRVAGDTKQVIMHMKLPAADLPGQVDDWEFRAVSRNGRSARMMSSPAVPRILARTDADFAKEMAEINRMASRSILSSVSQGPFGAVNAIFEAGVTAMADVEAPIKLKQAEEFFSWQCLDSPPQKPVDRTAPPPMTDLKTVGDNTINGVAVTTYEFFVTENGRSQGPVQMHVAKDTGLPSRIEMHDAQSGMGMQLDYVDFNKGGDIEIPSCLSK